MHEKHRERVRKRFIIDGADNMEPHNILELILFYAIPRKDTNEIAHKLIDRFGTLSGVLDASYGELLKVDGIGESAAVLIKLFPEVSRYYNLDKMRNIKIIKDTETAGKLLLPMFTGRNDEAVVLMCLDSKRKVLNISLMFEGSVNSTEINIRKIVETALRYNSSTIIIAHNHPGGLAIPSNEDVSTTRRVKNVLNGMGIELLDHIVVAEDDFVSFAESRLLRDD